MKQLLARFFREVKEHQKQNADTQSIDISHIAKSGILGAMTGDIAAAYYGIPDKIASKALEYLPEEMVEVLKEFARVVLNNKNK